MVVDVESRVYEGNFLAVLMRLCGDSCVLSRVRTHTAGCPFVRSICTVPG